MGNPSPTRRTRRTLVIGALASSLLGVVTASSAAAGTAPAKKDEQISYRFTFVNGTTVTGTATSNTAYISNAGGTNAAAPIGMNVHVSCSDPFTGGWGVKDGPKPTVDSAWQISNYQITKGSKTCGGQVGPIAPSHPKIDIEMFVNGVDADTPTGPAVTVPGSVAITYVVTNNGKKDLRSVAVVDNQVGAITCPSTRLSIGASMSCTARTAAVTTAGQKSANATVTGVADGPPAAAPAPAKDQVTYQFVFVNGRKVTGTATSNTAFLANAGGTNAAAPIGMNVHVSCSDPFTGGWGVKDGPNPTRDSAWKIASYQIRKADKKGEEKVCNQTFSPTTQTVTDSDPVHYRGVNPPDPKPSSLGDFVWNDLDRDGIQDAGEPGIAGVTLTLLKSNGTPATDLAGKPVAAQTTKADGKYLFTNLPADSYRIDITVGCTWRSTTLRAGTNRAKDSDATNAPVGNTCRSGIDSITLPADTTNLTFDAGYVRQSATLGDFVWHDLDRDGIQDAGEPGIADAWVTLLNLDGSMPTDVNGTPLGSRSTKADGKYLFTDLRPGNYRLYVSLPCDWQATTADAGTDDARDSDTTYLREDTGGRCLTRTQPITVAALTNNRTIDAGYVKKVDPPKPSSLGDFVWHDLDRDGIQDAGEPGIADAWVTLLNLDGSMPTDVNGTPLGSRSTKADGKYLFTDLRPGNYRLYVSLPCDWQATTADAGTDDARDSDTTYLREDTGGRCLTRTQPITVAAGIDNRTIDAGYVRST